VVSTLQCQKKRPDADKKDLERPACGQCTKSRLVCGGPRDLAFVVYEGRQGVTAPKQEVYSIDGARTAATGDLPSSKLMMKLPLSRDDVCTAFARRNLLPENGHIVVPNSVDRTITAQCFLALSYTYFGVKHHEHNITQDGIRQYGNALTVLNDSLAKTEVVRSFDVLESIMIMAMIEVSKHSPDL
jgi:hypothetical protein